MVAHSSVASCKPKVELDSHADMCVVGDSCLVIYDCNGPFSAYRHFPKDDHLSAKTVDATVGYQDLQSSQKFILMIKKAICIDALVNHLLCPMQCHLNGVQINEVPKFFAKNSRETSNAIEFVDPFDATHPLIILFQLSSATSYFDVYTPSATEYENDDISKIHLTAQEHPWDPSMNEYADRGAHMLDH